MTLLLIDIGNTAIHWAVKETGQSLSPMQSRVYLKEDLPALSAQLWADLPPVQAIGISSVAGNDINTALQQWVAGQWSVTPQFVTTPAQGNGIQNAYTEPAKLGADRWSAMVGAFQQNKSACCVLDCGTAVTFDVVATNGEHLGGWITPGYRLNQQILSQQTAGIRLNGDSAPKDVFFGCTTQECIDIAWHQGIVSLAQRSLLASGQDDVKCYLTGGDAARLQSLLGKEWCYAKDLVLQGLAIIMSQD